MKEGKGTNMEGEKKRRGRKREKSTVTLNVRFALRIFYLTTQKSLPVDLLAHQYCILLGVRCAGRNQHKVPVDAF